jgi:hypothetical protein
MKSQPSKDARNFQISFGFMLSVGLMPSERGHHQNWVATPHHKYKRPMMKSNKTNVESMNPWLT